MKLYLLRHGDAGNPVNPKFQDDTQRALTPKGIKRTRQLASALRLMEISFNAIYSSPYTRARQTAEIVARTLKLENRLSLTDHLVPGSEFDLIMSEVDESSKAVLLVGHEPFLSGLISWLCTGGHALGIELKKGGLCRLEIEKTKTGFHTTLEWLLSPRHFGPKRAIRSS